MEEQVNYDGPVSSLGDARVSVNYDDHAQEWVVRINDSKGSFAVCGCPGLAESDLVAKCIAAVVALADCTFSETLIGDNAGEVRCSNLVEYDAMKESAVAAIGSIESFLSM